VSDGVVVSVTGYDYWNLEVQAERHVLSALRKISYWMTKNFNPDDP